uniref:Putative ovule protein n=1 Tax=Solanum chacoense TaxID=4108 RepID=A0A0V0IHS9_SOLCH
MATKTRDIAPIVKGKRSPSTSKTRSLAHTNAINLIASNRKNTYLKSKVSSSPEKTQGKKPTPSTYPNIHHKQTLDYRTSIDKPPSNFDNTQVKKNPTLLNDLNIVHNKPNVARGSLFDNRPSLPSSLDNVQAKKIASSSSSIHNKQNPAQRRLSFDNKPPQSPNLDHNTHGKKIASDTNTHNKQNLARRRLSFDHRPPLSSFHDHSPQSMKLVPKSDHSIHRKQTPTRRRLSIDHKPPLSSPLPSPLLKSRTSSTPRERILKPSMPSSSKNSTSHKPLLNKFPKTPHTSSKNVAGKQHSVGLYAKALTMTNTITKNQDSPFGLTSDIIANIVPHEGKEEDQELVIEDNGELSETVNIDEYLKAAESSSLYVVENQEVIKNMEVPKEEQLLVDETSIIENHKELEEIKNLEPSNHDLEEIEKQENENQEEKEKDQENETPLDDCEQKKDEGKELDLKIDQEESEGRNNKEKEENNNKVSTTTMTFAKAYTHLVHKKEIVVSSNDVIEETASKLREQRKNRVKALASAFETVISLQDSK